MDTHDRADTNASTAAQDPTAVDTVAYPISPDYVKSWTPVRALCELIANALDEDRDATVAWADGALTIADDGPGIPFETPGPERVASFQQIVKRGLPCFIRKPRGLDIYAACGQLKRVAGGGARLTEPTA